LADTTVQTEKPAVPAADTTDYQNIRRALDKSVASVWPDLERADLVAHAITAKVAA
jgi:hypothetical protein